MELRIPGVQDFYSARMDKRIRPGVKSCARHPDLVLRHQRAKAIHKGKRLDSGTAAWSTPVLLLVFSIVPSSLFKRPNASQPEVAPTLVCPSHGWNATSREASMLGVGGVAWSLARLEARVLIRTDEGTEKGIAAVAPRCCCR